MINWGKEVIRLAISPDFVSAGSGPPLKPLFITAAQDLWVDMVCPLKGDRKDPEVYRDLLQMLHRHAPESVL